METKPGLQTTEFWVTLFTSGAALVDLFGLANYVPDTVSGIILAAVTGLYNVSRGVAKAAVKPVPVNSEIRGVQ